MKECEKRKKWGKGARTKTKHNNNKNESPNGMGMDGRKIVFVTSVRQYKLKMITLHSVQQHCSNGLDWTTAVENFSLSRKHNRNSSKTATFSYYTFRFQQQLDRQTGSAIELFSTWDAPHTKRSNNLDTFENSIIIVQLVYIKMDFICCSMCSMQVTLLRSNVRLVCCHIQQELGLFLFILIIVWIANMMILILIELSDDYVGWLKLNRCFSELSLKCWHKLIHWHTWLTSSIQKPKKPKTYKMQRLLIEVPDAITCSRLKLELLTLQTAYKLNWPLEHTVSTYGTINWFKKFHKYCNISMCRWVKYREKGF